MLSSEDVAIIMGFLKGDLDCQDVLADKMEEAGCSKDAEMFRNRLWTRLPLTLRYGYDLDSHVLEDLIEHKLIEHTRQFKRQSKSKKSQLLTTLLTRMVDRYLNGDHEMPPGVFSSEFSEEEEDE